MPTVFAFTFNPGISTFTFLSCCQQFSLSVFSRLLKLLWQYKVLFLPVVLKHPINLLFLSFLFGPNLAQICQHWLVLLTNQERNGKQKSRRRQLFLRGKTGQRLWERGGMFNKSWKENFHKIYLAVAQKPLLLIQVCESSIELRNIKSLNVRTLMFQLGGGTTTGGTTAQGGNSQVFPSKIVKPGILFDIFTLTFKNMYHCRCLWRSDCIADILWICQKLSLYSRPPPVCLYQMCCILNFHWISSGYFHKTPPNPLFTRHINVIENVIIYLQPHCGHLRAWFSVSKGSQQKWTYIYQSINHLLTCFYVALYFDPVIGTVLGEDGVSVSFST